MSIAQSIIALYIHPDSGPIMPMPLNIMEVEIVAQRVPSGADRDDARIREITKRIRDKFPEIEPENRRSEVASLIGRLNHVYLFNGIVLRLPGTIKGEVSASPAPSKETKEEINRLAQEVQQLKRDFQKEHAEHDATKVRFYKLESENKRLKVLHDKANREVADLHVQVQQATEKAEQARTAIITIRAERDALQAELDTSQQKAASLEVQLEQARATLKTQLEQTRPDVDAELSALRQNVTNAEQTERQLRETIEERERDIDELRERIRRLTEDTQHTEDTVESDPYRDWNE